VDVRRVGRLLAPAASLALILTLLLAVPAGAQQPRISQNKAIEIARLDPKAVSATEQHPDLAPSASRNQSTGLWEVG
jgi:hypothetical protein